MFAHILAPTDFSQPANDALALAVAIAEKFNSRITLVHVVTPPALIYADMPSYDFITPLEEAARAELARVLETLRAKWPSADSLLRHGPAANEILNAIASEKADLVVMATRGRGALNLNRLLVGSVAERIVRESPVPVLTARSHK